MIIYEVNLTIKLPIFDEYYQWLIAHANKMLAFPGFQTAEIGLIENIDDTTSKKLRVSYTITAYHHLEDYLTNHAITMRGEAIQKFGDQFSATRRIMTNVIII